MIRLMQGGIKAVVTRLAWQITNKHSQYGGLLTSEQSSAEFADFSRS